MPSAKHKRFKAKRYYSRLDHFLVESLPGMTRSQIVKLIQDNHVTLNGKVVIKKNHEVEIDDVVDMAFPQIEKPEYTPGFQLTKLYEDDYLLIIDKPYGVSVHPGSGEPHETVLDVFRYYYPQVNDIKTSDKERPGIVHRLDKDTSGVLILAKDTVTMRRLQKQFKRREVHKTYVALVYGHMRYRNGTIDAPIARSTRNRTRFKVVESDTEEKAREAVTEYSVIREFDDFSFVRLFPLTGRTHQLRVHLSHSGNPVLGDPTYGKNHPFARLALHAYSVEFRHPITGVILQSFSPFPQIFRDFLKKNF
ncbi:MAG: RluA family pseudouridine synthase [Candidatus Omnitrophota bacterium]